MIKTEFKGSMLEGLMVNRLGHIFKSQETFNKDLTSEIRSAMDEMNLGCHTVHRLSVKLYGANRAIPKSTVQDFITCKTGTSAYNLFRIMQVLFHYEAGNITLEVDSNG